MRTPLRETVRALLPQPLIGLVTRRRLSRLAETQGLKIDWHKLCIDIGRSNNLIRVSSRHLVYVPDIVASFDYYFSAVTPVDMGSFRLVDYSTPRLHEVVGFDDFPVLFPSFSEPVVTTEQYLEFAGLRPGMVVMDLGAYAGLTSILFAGRVCPKGRVVAVDADEDNFRCLTRNIAQYQHVSGHRIEAIHGAVWNHSNGIEFSGEGNMGASATSFVGQSRGTIRRVPSFTLDELAKKFDLRTVDFIKCDIEGAESVALLDAAFFQRFRPRMIIETHMAEGVETTLRCVDILTPLGYTCKRIAQHGVQLPLLECTP